MKVFYKISSISLAVLILIACGSEKSNHSNKTSTKPSEQPALVQLDPSKSDSSAINLAKKVIGAHGGMDQWRSTEYVAWNFFGARNLYWNKHTGDVKIEIPDNNSTFLINLNEGKGRIQLNGSMVTDKDSVTFYTDRAKQIWVNDSYWMFFPFKLLDKGVILSDLGSDSTQNEQVGRKLGLTFESVGYTPQNKYHIYIDENSYKILQWDYFAQASDSMPRFQLQWAGYEEHGNLLFSTQRGERVLEIIDIGSVPNDSIFTVL